MAVQTIENAYLQAQVSDETEEDMRKHLSDNYASPYALDGSTKRRKVTHLVDVFHSETFSKRAGTLYSLCKFCTLIMVISVITLNIILYGDSALMLRLGH